MDIVESIKQALLALGAPSVMWLMLLLSLVSVAIMLERTWFFMRHRCDMVQLTDALDTRLTRGDLAGARQLLAGAPAIEARIAARGLSQLEHGPVAVQEAIAAAVLCERPRLARGLSYLGTLASNAPFVGLFGTVIGIVLAFDELSATGARGSASAAVMGSIAEALVATAVGIGVAVPAVVAYNHFEGRIQATIDRALVLEHMLLHHLARGPVSLPARFDPRPNPTHDGRGVLQPVATGAREGS